MAVHNLKHVSVALKDASATPISVTAAPGPGNFTHADTEEGCVSSSPVVSRGEHYELVEGDYQPVDFSIEVIQDGKVTDTGSGKPADAVLKQGTFASGTTVDPGGVVWTINVVLTSTRAGVTATCTLTNCRCRISYAEQGDGNRMTISGTAYGLAARSTKPLVWS